MNKESECKRQYLGYASDEQVKEYCQDNSGGHCWSCKFFDQSEPLTSSQWMCDEEKLGFPIYTLDGKCRCHSPRHGTDDEGDDTALWPWVQGSDWCGEYKADAMEEAMERLKGPRAT